MGTRRSCLLLVLLLLPAEAWADRHNWEGAAGASRTSGSSLWGGHLSGAWVIPSRAWDWSLFLDVGKQAGEGDRRTLSQLSLLGGARWAFLRAAERPLKRPLHEPAEARKVFAKLQLFLHGTGGIVHTSGADTAGALGVGGGMDVLFSEFGGMRAQADHVWYWPEAGSDRFLRLSIGVVYRFEYH